MPRLTWDSCGQGSTSARHFPRVGLKVCETLLSIEIHLLAGITVTRKLEIEKTGEVENL